MGRFSLLWPISILERGVKLNIVKWRIFRVLEKIGVDNIPLTNRCPSNHDLYVLLCLVLWSMRNLDT
jgi:hypothetical protein